MTNSALIIRDFYEDDYPELIKFWASLNLSRPEREDDLQIIEKTIHLGGKLLIAELDRKIIGSAWITNNGRRLYLHHMGVSSEFQTQGVGTAIMHYVNAFASEMKMQIKLEVHKENVAAQKLYRKFGFKALDGYDVLIRREF